MSEPSGGPLTPAESAGETWTVGRYTPQHQWPTSLPDTMSGWKTLINCLGSTDIVFGPDGSVMIEMEHFLLLPREEMDPETGETRWYPWLVLVDPEGRTFGTSSAVAIERIGRIVEAIRRGKLTTPVAVQITQRRAVSSGRIYHDVKVM